MPLSRYRSLFYPTDLEILQRVFDQLTRERGMKPDSEEGQALAAEIVRLWEVGLEDETELLKALSMDTDKL